MVLLTFFDCVHIIYGMKEPAVSIRFEKSDLMAVKDAARIEGLDFASYCRRCVVLHTRDRHPETFRRSDPLPTVDALTPRA
jgi:predicted DNA binding CopG/RHH family protein